MSYINADLRETHMIGSNTREFVVGPQVAHALSIYHISLAGISYALPPFHFVRPRGLCQLLACLDGYGHVLINEQWQVCLPGMLYLTPPGVPHAYYAAENNTPWKICWITYDVKRQERPIIDLEQPALIQAGAQELVMAVEGLYHEAIGHAEEGLLGLWSQLVQAYAQRLIGQTCFDARLLRLWKLVDTNLAHNWHNEELATAAGISSEHLRRLCQQQFAHSPMKHVTALRMQRAMALLASDSYNVGSVSLRVGYENPFAFSTAFKRYTGVPPSLYKNK